MGPKSRTSKFQELVQRGNRKTPSLGRDEIKSHQTGKDGEKHISNENPKPIGSQQLTQPTESKQNSQPTEVKLSSQPTEMKLSSQPTETKLSSQQTEMKLSSEPLTATQRKNRLRTCIIKVYLHGKKCVVCGESDVALLENDHVRGKKMRLKNGNLIRGFSVVPFHLTQEEFSKCDPACIWCHRIRTPEAWDPTRYASPAIKNMQARVDAEKKIVGKCETCKEPVGDRPFLFDWNRKDLTEKSMSVSQMVVTRKDWNAIKAKIGKCNLLCCRCARKRTAQCKSWLRLEDFTAEEQELAKIYVYGTPEQISAIGLRTPVVQAERFTGQVIAIFPSLSDAARDIKGGDAAAIKRCLQGKYEQHAGYWFLTPTADQLKLIANGRVWRNPEFIDHPLYYDG